MVMYTQKVEDITCARHRLFDSMFFYSPPPQILQIYQTNYLNTKQQLQEFVYILYYE